LGSITGEEFLD